MLPDCLRDTDQPSADRLVQTTTTLKQAQYGPGASTSETKAKPETAEPCGQLSPLIPETATAASWRLAVGGWYRVLDSRQLGDRGRTGPRQQEASSQQTGHWEQACWASRPPAQRRG